MPKIRFVPAVSHQYKIVGGHKYQYFTLGREYPVLEVCGYTGFRVKDDSGVDVWVSRSDLRKFFPNADSHAVTWQFSLNN